MALSQDGIETSVEADQDESRPLDNVVLAYSFNSSIDWSRVSRRCNIFHMLMRSPFLHISRLVLLFTRLASDDFLKGRITNDAPDSQQTDENRCSFVGGLQGLWFD